MIDFLYSIDVSIFYLVNHTISNPVFDKFFVFITEVKHWYIAYIILLGIGLVLVGIASTERTKELTLDNPDGA